MRKAHMTHQARLVLDPAFPVGPVDPRLFGSFVEHVGRCVYTGIYEPGHQAADSDGLRTDVLDLIRELGVAAIRYPGGNFVSGYNWEDGSTHAMPTFGAWEATVLEHAYDMVDYISMHAYYEEKASGRDPGASRRRRFR
jgi:alpha-L-arabinofuranosidase